MLARVALVAFTLLCADTALAAGVASLGGVSGVQVLPDRGHAAQGVCFTPLGETTAEDPTTLRCAMPGNAEPAVVPAFHRPYETLAVEWAIDVSAALRRTAWRGNALFAFYDVNDPHAIEEDRYTALYQADIAKANKLHAHVHISPASGFQSGHTYRMRIGQLINGQLIVLAEGDLKLE